MKERSLGIELVVWSDSREDGRPSWALILPRNGHSPTIRDYSAVSFGAVSVTWTGDCCFLRMAGTFSAQSMTCGS